VHTDTIAANTNVITNNTVVAVAANDYITVDVTSAGTGATDLTVMVRIVE
jgi:glutamate synthase domain-containing protein 2